LNLENHISAVIYVGLLVIFLHQTFTPTQFLERSFCEAMSFTLPNFTRGQINRAGSVLIDNGATTQARADALALINHWRACHAYPINTFQATLRGRVKRVFGDADVATRLKRLPSISKKLTLNQGMQLARMQDIGGLRAVVETVVQVRNLHEKYGDGTLAHELVAVDDYIASPKVSGYRSLHLIYKYKNTRVPAYDGLSLELQIRTRLQHAWATAVETIGSFLNQALKSSEGSAEWLGYFKVVSSAFAVMEDCPVAQEHANLSHQDIFQRATKMGEHLDVKRKLNAFAVATGAISSSKAGGNYHLIVLDAVERTVVVSSFGQRRLDEANAAYAEAERQASNHPDMQTVLVATSSIDALRRAFPNYFLDTEQFLSALARMEKLAG
jgi:putative GTP pyrophosphokinase